MSEPIEFTPEEFNKSLPADLTHALFFTALTFKELALKCNLVIGRVYENKETGEGFFISGIKQIITRDMTEFHTIIDGESEQQRPVVVIHAIVLPEFEEIGPKQEEEESGYE